MGTHPKEFLIVWFGLCALTFATMVIRAETKIDNLKAELSACHAEAIEIEEDSLQLLPPPTEQDWK